MVELYICKICGEPYLGGEAPDDCPFCGAPKNFLKPFTDYSKLWETEVNEEEKKELKETLNLEINATAFYKSVADHAPKHSKVNRLFKQLARVENEHAEVVSKFLNTKLPEIKGEKTKGNQEEDLKRTHELETHAIEKYTLFLNDSKSTNLKLFYTALIHAEKGHQEISQSELDKLH